MRAEGLADAINNRHGLDVDCGPDENAVFDSINERFCGTGSAAAGSATAGSGLRKTEEETSSGTSGSLTGEVRPIPTEFQAWVFPNPTHDQDVRISYSVTGQMGPSRVDIAVFDVSGRQVRQLETGIADPGEHTLTWNLEDRTGQRVSSGLYFFRVTVGSEQVLLKQLVLGK